MRAFAAASMVAAGVGTWIISPRASLSSPSLIDDWWSIAFSPGELHRLGGFLAADGPRFRPAYSLWNYLQWHLLGAPESLLWPNLVNVLRLLLLVTGMGAFTALALGSQRAIGRGLDYFALVALPPLLVVTVPQFAVDLARFGPQEPVLIGGMMLGGCLLFVACRDLVSEGDTRDTTRISVLLAVGYCLWLLGIYQKESSVCVALVAGFLAFGSRNRLCRSLAALETRRRVYVAGIAVAVGLPVAHVAAETFVIAHRGGKTVLGADQKLADRAGHVRTALETMTTVLGSRVGWWLFAAVVFGITLGLIRRRPDWTQIGLLLGAAATLAWSTQVGLYPSRYYMPAVALLAVGFSRLVARVPALLRWASIAAFLSAAESTTTLFGTRFGWCILAAIGFGIVLGLIRRRSDWPQIALLVGALTAQAWSPKAGLYPNGHYQPVIALLAVGSALLLLRRPALVTWAPIAVLVSLTVLTVGPARTAVDDWVAPERTAGSLVDRVARLTASGCPVVVTGLDVERAQALPVLVALHHLRRAPCRTSEAFVVRGSLHPDPALLAVCAAHDRQALGSWALLGETVRVTRCSRIAVGAGSLVASNRMR